MDGGRLGSNENFSSEGKNSFQKPEINVRLMKEKEWKRKLKLESDLWYYCQNSEEKVNNEKNTELQHSANSAMKLRA